MYCSGCGLAMMAGQAVCPRCGLGYGAGMNYGPEPYRQGPYGHAPYGPMRVMPSLPMVERRINSLAMGWMIYAAMVAITGVIGLLFAHAALTGGMGPWGHEHGHWHSFFNGLALPLFFVKLGWVMLMLRVGLAFAAGYGLQQKTTWGRWVAIVAGCLSLIHPPFGTAIGIWTLVVLLNAPNAAGYEAMAQG